MRLLELQLVRYLLAGGTVGLSYLLLTLGLDGVIGLPIQVAIPIALVIALTLHFMLQRHFVFAHGEGFALTGREQLRKYVLWCVVQYPVTAVGTEALPSLLGVSHQVAYVTMTVLISATGFLLLSSRVFHAHE